MPFDGSGNFSRLYSWQADRDNGIRILASKMDGEFDNFAGGMNVVFFRNGLVPMSGNLNMGQNYLYGLGAGSVGALPFRFGDDATTGLYLNGPGRLNLVSQGATRLEVTNGGVNVIGALQQGGSQVWHAGNLNPAQYAALTGATFTGTVIAPFITVKGGAGQPAYTVHDATANTNGRKWRTGETGSTGAGTWAVYSESGNVTPMYLDGGTGSATFLYDVNVAGNLRRNGNTVWDAANFNPANYARLDGASFNNPITVGNGGVAGVNIAMRGAEPYLSFISNDQTVRYGYIQHGGPGKPLTFNNEATGVMEFRLNGGLAATLGIGGTFDTQGALRQQGQQVWYAGNFNPANYAALSGASFTGGVDMPRLAINPTGSAYGLVVAQNGNGPGFMQLGNNGSQSDNNWHFGTATDGTLRFYSGTYGFGIERVRFDNTGRLYAGAVYSGGNPVLTTADFTPTLYAKTTGATFTGAVIAPLLTVKGDPNQPAYVTFDATANANGRKWRTGETGSTGAGTWAVYSESQNITPLYIDGGTGSATFQYDVNVAGTLRRNNNVVWDAANFNPNAYAALSGAAFTGAISAPSASIGSVGISGTGLSVGNGGISSTGGLTVSGGGGAAIGGGLAVSSGNLTVNAGTVSASGSISSGGQLTAVTPNSGTTGGLVLRADGARSVGYVQFVNSNGTAEYANLSVGAGGQGTWSTALNVVGALQQNGQQVYHTGNLNLSGYLQTAGGTMTGDITRSGGGQYAYQAASGLSARMSRGTAAPSGGSDGDLYFQYT